MKKDPISAAVRALLSQALNKSPGDLRFGEITQLFPWAKMHSFFWAVDRDRNSAVAATRIGEGEVLLLSDDLGIAKLSQILIAEIGTIPGGIDAREFASSIRRLTVAPPGIIASSDMFSGPTSPPMEGWLINNTTKDRDLLRSQLVQPTLDIQPDKSWILRFRYFNPKGGVESWVVSGDSGAIRAAELEIIVPNGTFNWPFEG